MVRNGKYSRGMIDESGQTHILDIQRVRCRSCNASHALLYDFLVPYRRYDLKALKKAVDGYIAEPNSYLEALTGVVGDAATLFKAVEYMLFHLPFVWMHLMRMAIGMGIPIEEIARNGVCPNSFKCKKVGKKEQLDWAARLRELIPNVFEIASKEGYPMFSSGRGCELLRTHSAECALF